MKPAAGFYVTGTDTGVGKTLASVCLVHALRSRGLRVAAMKPVASGARRTRAGLRNEDAEALLHACTASLPYADVNPYALVQPTAPEIAASIDGVRVELAVIEDAFRRLAAVSDVVVVEGVGGWEAPLAEQLLQSELCRQLELQVVLVVGLRLGCLNHARLTQRALHADGVRWAGWIDSHVDAQILHPTETAALLQRDLRAPQLGSLPFCAAPDPRELAQLLRVGALLP